MSSAAIAMPQSTQVFRKESISSRRHVCVRPAALLCRPGVAGSTRPRFARRAYQCNPQGASFRWAGSRGPRGVYWTMNDGAKKFSTFKELWKELADLGLGVNEERWRKYSNEREAGSVRPLAVDVEEDDDGYTLTADVPGLSKEDLKVQVDKDRYLTISGERKRSEGTEENDSADTSKQRKQYERAFGKFSRKLKLPEDADVECIAARVEAGVLYLSIRRMENMKPVDVPIS